jgi:SAM-dependent methyltransferase
LARSSGSVSLPFDGMTTSGYKQDLAYVHDVGFGSFAERSAAGVLNILRGAGIHSGLVVDIGCGGGLWARRLTDAAYGVLGIDLSPDMIALARKRAPKGSFRAGSFLDVDFPDCVAITALGECFNYTFDRRNSRASLSRLFRRAFRALRPGGLLIFDVAQPGRAQGSNRCFWQGPDWACLTGFVQDEPRQVLTRQIITFRKVGQLYRRCEETHVQRLYRASQLAGDLRKVGFRVRTVRGYGDLRFPKALAGLIARKPS